MYVLTYNDQVLLGPMNWNSRMFNSVILDDTEIKTNILPSDFSKVPLDLGNGLKIRVADSFYPPLNQKTQMYNGPFWVFTDDLGTASYVVIDKPLDFVKQELTASLAHARWVREESGVKATVQGLEVTVDTVRGSRDIFVQQFLLMPDGGSSQWKFPEGWLTLTKSDLGICVGAGVTHVQDAFVWESITAAEIAAATTLAELDAIVISEPNITDINQPFGVA